MINDLLLISGNDIPFAEAQITIHQPLVKEIAYIGEEDFFTGYQMLKVSKNNINIQDNPDLEKLTNFDILIAILRERNAVMQRNKNCVIKVLSLLFPLYAISIENNGIALIKEDNDEEKHYINNDNFSIFQKVIKSMFGLEGDGKDDDDFNPDGNMASRIAQKLRERHQKLSQIKNNNEKIDLISRYCSILSIGLSLDLNRVLNYTLYQLMDQVERYNLKVEYDVNIRARMAGAKDLDDPKNWMEDIHPNK